MFKRLNFQSLQITEYWKFRHPMEIRKDFESAATFLHRLAGIGQQFSIFNHDDWPHYKNEEDFERIYRLPENQRFQFEKLYGDGRDCAIFMSSQLCSFNDVGQFPSLSEYVDCLENTWAYEHESLQAFIDRIKVLSESLTNTPWAVKRMIELFDKQLRLLASVRQTVELLRQTNLYKIEKGEVPVERDSSINIGQITGKVNINSTDNSTNIAFESSPIFASLTDAISNSQIETAQKVQILAQVDAMKQAQGTTGFLQKYKDFMQNAANHMTVVSPFIPALTTLIG
ncbi:MAG: hypothetical protein IPF65_01675 [Polaromonas sp.]|nr:hypothetical protein [Polaromonas sp.]